MPHHFQIAPGATVSLSQDTFKKYLEDTDKILSSIFKIKILSSRQHLAQHFKQYNVLVFRTTEKCY